MPSLPSATIMLQQGRERPVLARHPWVFSGAIARVMGRPADGDEVDVQTIDGEWVARGTWSSASQIRVRLFTWDDREHLEPDLIRARLERAFALRQQLPLTYRSNAYRVVYSEADGLPGLIVDRYGDDLVIQILTQGMAVRLEQVLELLVQVFAPRSIYERSDADVRQKEGLPQESGLRWGAPAPAAIQFRTHDLSFSVDWRDGQKTGFYLDQSDNRLRVASYAVGREMLDCFCYSGGFAVYAARAGAPQITAVDSSAGALARVATHMQQNNLHPALELVEADVFKQLRQYRLEERDFDLIVLDPPKFAHSQQQIDRATRGYKDINMNAMRLLRQGGILATFSCSGLLSAELFQKVVFGAALDAHREVQILERLTQAADHPVLLSFPESEYLKGFICRVW